MRNLLINSIRMLGTSGAHADFPEQSQASFPGLVFSPLNDSPLLAGHPLGSFPSRPGLLPLRVFQILLLVLF